MTDAPAVLGTIRTLEDLQAVMRARALELGVTQQSVGRAAMLPTRYANKLLAPAPKKKLGVLSIPGLLEALQLELVAVPRTDVPKRITDKLDKHRVSQSVRAVRHVRMLSKRFLRANAKKGGRALAIKLSPRARRISAKKAARARWDNVNPIERAKIAQRLARTRWNTNKPKPKRTEPSNLRRSD